MIDMKTALLLILASLHGAAAQVALWSQTGGNSYRSGVSLVPGVTHAPSEAWTLPLGGGVPNATVTALLLGPLAGSTGGRDAAYGAGLAYAASTDGTVRALNVTGFRNDNGSGNATAFASAAAPPPVVWTWQVSKCSGRHVL
jgi:hypothetical protein